MRQVPRRGRQGHWCVACDRSLSSLSLVVEISRECLTDMPVAPDAWFQPERDWSENAQRCSRPFLATVASRRVTDVIPGVFNGLSDRTFIGTTLDDHITGLQ